MGIAPNRGTDLRFLSRFAVRWRRTIPAIIASVLCACSGGGSDGDAGSTGGDADAADVADVTPCLTYQVVASGSFYFDINDGAPAVGFSAAVGPNGTIAVMVVAQDTGVTTLRWFDATGAPLGQRSDVPLASMVGTDQGFLGIGVTSVAWVLDANANVVSQAGPSLVAPGGVLGDAIEGPSGRVALIRCNPGGTGGNCSLDLVVLDHDGALVGSAPLATGARAYPLARSTGFGAVYVADGTATQLAWFDASAMALGPAVTLAGSDAYIGRAGGIARDGDMLAATYVGTAVQPTARVDRFDPGSGAVLSRAPIGPVTNLVERGLIPSFADGARGTLIAWTNADANYPTPYDAIWGEFVDAAGVASPPFCVDRDMLLDAPIALHTNGAYVVVWHYTAPGARSNDGPGEIRMALIPE